MNVWVLLLNATVVAVMIGVTYVAQSVGWELCIAFVAGYFYCYAQFKCWRQDHDEPVIDLTDHQQLAEPPPSSPRLP